MTLRTVERLQPRVEHWYRDFSTRRIRFASQGFGDNRMMVIWIGGELAKKIGLDAPRQNVDFLIDDAFPQIRAAAIRPNPYGDFRCARRSSNYGVWINRATYRRLFSGMLFNNWLEEQQVRIEGDTLHFVIPASIKP